MAQAAGRAANQRMRSGGLPAGILGNILPAAGEAGRPEAGEAGTGHQLRSQTRGGRGIRGQSGPGKDPERRRPQA